MPKSKRARVVPTSKTGKNRKEQVRRLHSNIRAAVSAPTGSSHVWVFSVQNVRNSLVKQVRAQLADCRVFMGKTKVMGHALLEEAKEREREQEHEQEQQDQGAAGPAESGLRLLTPHLVGEVGLLLTDRPRAEIEAYFARFRAWDYARAGTVAGQGFTITAGGPLTTAFSVDGEGGGSSDDPVPVAVEPTLRKLGVPTRIVKGKVVLEKADDGSVGAGGEGGEGDYVVCRAGEVLDSRQTTLLKIFGVKMAEFSISLKAVWNKADGSVNVVSGVGLDGEGDTVVAGS
jgi:mRNA turnover protein 4